MSSLARSSRTLWYVLAALVVVALFMTVLLLRLATPSLKISGDAGARMRPGLNVPLDVSFTNSYDFDVSVSNLRVAVRNVKAPHTDPAHRCSVDDFAVEQVSAAFAISVRAGATASLSSLHLAVSSWPRVHLRSRSVNQDGCQGASLTLRYTATRTLKLP